LTVAGTVIGTGGTAVSLTTGGRDRLILQPGALFAGTVDGGGGASVLEIAASALAGLRQASPIAVPIGGVRNFSAAQIDATADADASGNLSFDTLSNQGTVNLLAGAVVSFGTVISAASAGAIDVQAGGTVHFKGSVEGNQSVLFRPPGGLAIIDRPPQFGAVITSFTAIGDVV